MARAHQSLVWDTDAACAAAAVGAAGVLPRHVLARNDRLGGALARLPGR
ncbi:MAG: hypothetical protein ACRDQX_14240 [Pseudonocardiaceae bacterium]